MPDTHSARILISHKNSRPGPWYDTSKVDRLNIKICYFGGIFHVQKSKVYTGRKTTFEERKEIVDYCINHNRNYKNTAAKFDVSYSQVYSWVKKYDTDGADGLTDRRGRHKTDAEVDELERLRRENLRLKRQLEEKDMVVELLKKVKEFEGMWSLESYAMNQNI